ncbi:DUF421 domain-containing protein [Neobacillus dielmonensis]|uniref:DUF421 domain-containing protein n=1 Tax=Neobacillus dielmonensis TaxID=1347369 RepID=UPI0005A97F3F|nr:DUF421 domain-containing protein [Neobacillus dielmonensis]
MNFISSQESLTVIQWVLRAVVGFVFLIVIARILGQRAISQLRLIDFVIALVIGDVIAHPLSNEEHSFKGALITTCVLVLLYLIGIYLVLKFPSFRKLITPPAITVVKEGRILYHGLKKARISLDVLLEQLREQKADDVKKVALAIFEADGKISVFLDPKYEPVTPADCQIETQPFNLPRTIIKEGKINTEELYQSQKTREWVISTLQNQYQAEVHNVLLATLDNRDNLKVFFYK